MIANMADTIATDRVFRKCAACHVLEPGVHGVGPSLHKIVGKDIASAPGYAYSAALLDLPGVWTVQALDAYLKNPRAAAPGTTMAFNGLQDPPDRLAVIRLLMGPPMMPSLPEPDLALAIDNDINAAFADYGTIGALSTELPAIDKGIINALAGDSTIGALSTELPDRPQARASLTLPSPAPLDPAVDLMASQLKSADIAFNRPETMQLGQATSVELVLSPATAPRAPVAEGASTREVAESLGLSDALPGATQVVEDVQYALQMEAEISGLGFDVHPPGPQRQTVLPFQPAKWVWTIKPKSAGRDQVFTVNVNAIIQRDEENLPPIRITTFTERITVEVTLMQKILEYAKELTTLNAAIAGIGGTLVAVIGWLWTRTRKKKKPEPTKPSEVVVTHKFDEGV